MRKLILGLLSFTLIFAPWVSMLAQTATQHGVDFTWTPVASSSSYTVTGYAIFRGTQSGSTCTGATQIGTVTGQAAGEYIDPASGLATSDALCYEVQTLGTGVSTGTSDNSPASSPSDVTTPSSWPTTPPAPAGGSCKII